MAKLDPIPTAYPTQKCKGRRGCANKSVFWYVWQTGKNLETNGFLGRGYISETKEKPVCQECADRLMAADKPTRSDP